MKKTKEKKSFVRFFRADATLCKRIDKEVDRGSETDASKMTRTLINEALDARDKKRKK